ncbi:MAG TPA: hypothetical protein VMM13_18825, partial [Euzebya sp.]|nr:hypothetical protein [Euzebya sp.]
MAGSVGVMFRRKHLPVELRDAHDAFTGQVERLEAARSALMSCLPVGRVDPAPVAVGLDLLAATLEELEAELSAWRVPHMEEEWRGCVAAIAETRAHMHRAYE